MAIVLVFPLLAIYDYFIYFQELLKLEENFQNDNSNIKQFIQTFYKFVHYYYYFLSDILIPLLCEFYLLKNANKLGCNKPLSILNGIIFFIIFIIISVIIIIVIIYVEPEPTVNKIKENVKGWDGFIFNLRNIYSFFEYEYYLMLLIVIGTSNVIYYWRLIFRVIQWLFGCKSKDSKYNLIEYWKLGKSLEDNDSKTEDDIKLALNELKQERKKAIKDKIMDDLVNNKYCYCCCIPKCLVDLPLGAFWLTFVLIIKEFEIRNSFNTISNIDYENLESNWEKEEKRENIKKGIYQDLGIYFFVIYFYHFSIIYACIKQKYFDEYLPYIGGEHNGLAFLYLLNLILKILIPIYYLVFFPFIINEKKSIFFNYFEVYQFTIGKIWIILIKGSALVLGVLFRYCGWIHPDDLFNLFKEEDNNQYVREGENYYNLYKEDYKKTLVDKIKSIKLKLLN